MAGAVLVVSVALAGVSVASAAGADGTGDNEAPLADAGLDRDVSTNATVYLDATGSRDPDGEIAGYRWRIERPDGHFTTPSCERCGRTKFVPREPGTYNATVEVTDDDGATSTDTLRVSVERSNGPTVTLSGPDSVVEGGVADFSASVSAGANDLAAVVWRVDGRRLNRTTLTGTSASVDHIHAFRRDGRFTLSVTAVDRLGRQRTASKNVTVTDPSPDNSDGGGTAGPSDGSDGGPPYSGGGSDGESGNDDETECSRYDRDDDRYCGNDRMTMDSNGIVVSDADNDGLTSWAGVQLDEEFAQNHEGVSYDSVDGVAEFDSQEAYREALEVESVNVNPEADVNDEGLDSSQKEADQNSFSGSGGDTGDKSEGNSSSKESSSSSTEEEDSNSSSEQGSESTNNIPQRVIERIQEEKNKSGSTGNTGNGTNTRTVRVPPDLNSPVI
ncbi:PKD domain-containing protein [Halosimplex marinum]|uniref:PKD domain-containing protein n=1 Tax=Halosimplex marinum TaxID=3396620 RepID=UPI003F57AA70